MKDEEIGPMGRVSIPTPIALECTTIFFLEINVANYHSQHILIQRHRSDYWSLAEKTSSRKLCIKNSISSKNGIFFGGGGVNKILFWGVLVLLKFYKISVIARFCGVCAR